MQKMVDAIVRDPARFLAQMHEMHLRNAKAWADAAVGIDLANESPTFGSGRIVSLASNTGGRGRFAAPRGPEQIIRSLIE